MQLCGDAHLSNFGVFASPERRLLFDLNDFGETLPGPFEWDVKRMAASFMIAGRHNGFAKADTRAATQSSGAAYREAMATFAPMGTLAIWYAHLPEEELLAAVRSAAAQASKSKKTAKQAKGAEKRVQKATGKAHTRDSLQALSKLGEVVDGRYRIVSQPLIVVPVRDLEATYGLSSAQAERNVHAQFRAYRATLRDDQRQLLERFELVDAARRPEQAGHHPGIRLRRGDLALVPAPRLGPIHILGADRPATQLHRDAQARADVDLDKGQDDLAPAPLQGSVVHHRRSAAGVGRHARAGREHLLVVLQGLGALIAGAGPAQPPIDISSMTPAASASKSCLAAWTACCKVAARSWSGWRSLRVPMLWPAWRGRSA